MEGRTRKLECELRLYMQCTLAVVRTCELKSYSHDGHLQLVRAVGSSTGAVVWRHMHSDERSGDRDTYMESRDGSSSFLSGGLGDWKLSPGADAVVLVRLGERPPGQG